MSQEVVWTTPTPPATRTHAVPKGGNGRSLCHKFGLASDEEGTADPPEGVERCKKCVRALETWFGVELTEQECSILELLNIGRLLVLTPQRWSITRFSMYHVERHESDLPVAVRFRLTTTDASACESLLRRGMIDEVEALTEYRAAIYGITRRGSDAVYG